MGTLITLNENIKKLNHTIFLLRSFLDLVFSTFFFLKKKGATNDVKHYLKSTYYLVLLPFILINYK